MTTIEQERKYLVRNDSWRELVVASTHIRQAYLVLQNISFSYNDSILAVQTPQNVYEFDCDAVQYETLCAIQALHSDRTVLRIRTSSRMNPPTLEMRSYYLTLKGPVIGDSGLEAEFVTQNPQTKMLFDLGQNEISKIRHIVPFSGYEWEIDEFQGVHRGLILAEIENRSHAEFPPSALHMPPWIGDDVTSDFRYRNNNLAKHGLRQLSDQSIPGLS